MGISLEDVAVWKWLLALGLVLGSAFCSGTETALTALGDNRARQLRDANTGHARALSIWIDHPERVLSTLLIGNTLMSVGSGALAVSIAADLAKLARLSEATLVAISTALVTVVVLFLGEIVPKTVAKRHPVEFSLFVVPGVKAVTTLLWPLSSAASRVTEALVGLFGAKEPPGPAVTSEEIEYLIGVGTREGVLDEVKEELLNSVLEFADRVVREIMVPRTRMVAIDRAATPDDLLRVVTENPFSRMPVYEGTVDNVVGILLVKEIIQDLRQGPTAIALERRLKPVFFAPETMKIFRLLKEMQRRKTHLAVVVDEFGGTSGLVTLEDVLEEIVGEIQDEADAEPAPVRALGPEAWLAEAAVPLHELEAYLNEKMKEAAPDEVSVPTVRFPEEADYETLGGFVTSRAGRVPPVGAILSWGGFRFTVRAGDERRVGRVEITRDPKDAVASEFARS